MITTARRALLALVLSSTSALAEAPTPAPRTSIAESQQLVVVTTASWDAVGGTLRRFARTPTGWMPIGAAHDVVVGHKGLAWAAAQRPTTSTLPAKHEGDGRAPAGVFALGRVLGKGHVPKSGMPAAASTVDDVCVDDVAHAAYNRVGPTPKTWKSAEQLVRKDALYDVVVVIDHNNAITGTPVAGDGSCVFLHVWRAADKGTAGCTAMPRKVIDDVVAWLDADKHPLLVQLPKAVYVDTADSLGLPVLP